jgi:predicted N-formylglutamate amidohydrolase
MRILTAGEQPPWTALNPGAPSPFLFLGDHAGRSVPLRLGDLGLGDADLGRHIGWDIGVAGMGRLLSAALDATFIHQRFSRLVIDCNRDPARPDATPPVSDGTVVPGNTDLSAAQRQARIDEIARPYHDRIAAELDARAARGQSTILVSLHSFTPRMAGFDRPWRYGVLHAGGSPFSDAVLLRLRAALGDDLVGDNQPYSLDASPNGADFTVPVHAIRRGLDYLELETRQDLISDPAGQQSAAQLIAGILSSALDDI